MIPIERIREQLPGIRRFGPGLVAVFVGGTSGIGASTAREFVRYTTSPRLYLIGRSQQHGLYVKAELLQLNSSADVRFIQSDVSELRTVDEVCKQIQAQETKINLLCLSAGIFHLRGREETTEGLDQKMALDFYSRLRFIENFLPQLRLASSSQNEASQNMPSLARVISVLGGGTESSVNASDLSLKENYSTAASTNHAITMTTLSFAHLAAEAENNGIVFSHTKPGMVKTNGDRELGALLRSLLGVFALVFRLWTVPVQECGERHLWAALNPYFKGGTVHLVGPKSEEMDNSKMLNHLKEHGMFERVWGHTRDVFQAILKTEGRKY